MPDIDLHFDRAPERYTVTIRRGALATVPEIIKDISSSPRAIVLGDEKVLALYGSKLRDTGAAAGVEIDPIGFPASETTKSLQTTAQLYEELVRRRVERGTLLLALGGGIAGDVAGFVAASYLRGLPFVQIPTTLLAMVDASVGGKVGVNLPQGKNLVGAFYQPRAVIIDPEVLSTLPEREYRAGLAECIKHAMLGDAELFDWTEKNAERIASRDPEVLEELIHRNVSIKAWIVMEDEREQGRRAFLNLGHTFGHAIEAGTNYTAYLHGEAVSLGLVAAAELSRSLGLISSADVERSVKLLTRLQLPVRGALPPAEKLYELMKLDKKVEGENIRFVVLERIGSAAIRKGCDREKVLGALAAISANNSQ